MMSQQFPKGWDAARVRALTEELDARTEAEWLAADEAAAEDGESHVCVSAPTALMPVVRRLLAENRSH